MLTFLSTSQNKSNDGHIKWICRCDCGNVSEYIATRVRNKRVSNCKSCKAKKIGEKNRIHGARNTGTYSSWQSMKQRCLNKDSKDYPSYGGSGITICQSWIDSFEQFYIDMGERPKGCSIDRIDTTKGYSKENCRWSSRSEQQRNKLESFVYEIDGVVYQTLQEAADHFSVKKQTIKKWVDGWFDKRINKQWSPKNGCRKFKKY